MSFSFSAVPPGKKSRRELVLPGHAAERVDEHRVLAVVGAIDVVALAERGTRGRRDDEVDAVDAFLVAQSTLVNRRARSLFPICRERAQLADSLVRQLAAVGVRRRAKAVPRDLKGYIAMRDAEKKEG